MPVRQVTIKAADGRSWTLSAPFTIKKGATGALSIRVRRRNPVVLSMPGREDVYAKALARLSGLRYISSISGQRPTESGLFMLTGDRCFSWDDASDSGITVYDLCPACSSCEAYARLLRRLETCKIALNMLKDVNLYPDAIVQSRAAGLSSSRRVLPVSCGAAADDVPYIFSVRLLRQYVAAVYMWNYLVTMAGVRDEVIPAPDSASGIAVRTRYIASMCQPGTSLSVSISVVPNEGAFSSARREQLSAYVSDPEASILPALTGVTDPEPTVSTTRDEEDRLNITVDVDFNNTELRSGTYVVGFTVLPFVAMRGLHPTVIAVPTLYDYNTSVSLATVIHNDNRPIWKVTIKWTATWPVQGAQPISRTIDRTYLLETAVPGWAVDLDEDNENGG